VYYYHTTTLEAKNVDTDLKEQIEKMGTVRVLQSTILGDIHFYTGYPREGERPCQRERMDQLQQLYSQLRNSITACEKIKNQTKKSSKSRK